MNSPLVIIFSMIVSISAAYAKTATQVSQTVTVSGVLIGPIFGPGGATTGLAIYDHLNGHLIAEVRDNSHTAHRFIVDPCSTTYQPVQVSGKFEIEDLGPFARQVKVLEAQSITENGPQLRQDIRPAIADGLCPLARGHAAFVNLEAAFPSNLNGVYKGAPCTLKVSKTDSSMTFEVQSPLGGLQKCTLNDNDPKLTETKNSFSIFFANGFPGTFETPKACGITSMNVRRHTMVFISTPDDSTASCTVN